MQFAHNGFYKGSIPFGLIKLYKYKYKNNKFIQGYISNYKLYY